jgi:hypothetical protein
MSVVCQVYKLFDVMQVDIKNDGARYAFICRWHDPMTDIVWRYQFMYHTNDRSIEMVSYVQ